MKWSLLFSGIFLAYMGHSLWTIYSLFYPEPCPPKASCMTSFLTKNNILEMRVCFSKSERPSAKNCKFAWANDSVDTSEDFETDVIVNVPLSTRKNGTLWVHAFVMPKGEDPWSSQYVSQSKGLITTYAIPQSQTFNLMGDDNTNHSEKSSTNKREYVSHWRSRLTISIMTDEVLLNRQAVPMELFRFMRVTQKNEYLPLLYIDNLSNRMRDLMPLNESVGDMPLVINYRPISFGKLRLWCNMEESLKQLTNLGFTEKDTDEVKGIFADTNFFFLMLTFVVAAFHLLFDFLAFKNDISYWQERKSMIGLSTRTVVWRSVSTFIIFLYLLDEETSLLVLIPAGVGTIIEFWKVTKAFKVKVTWSGWKPSFELGAKSKKEQETENFDSEAMKYLSYLLIPLLIGLAVYSLMYTPHKSWYSWIINCLVNGIYAFGFVFMLPQLFLNYKLKSVAHLPWRAFMYKAFNTFIDDVFAFIITMPTAHRLACFRDDIVFVIYLYQRWLYPVDKKRVNEYGQSFTENEGQGDSPVDGQIEAKKIETKKTK